MAELGVNIDHVATIRQARMGIEPEPLQAALIAEQNGADQITIHLREDRRHIQDRDLKLMRRVIQTKLNLEMAANSEMVIIAKSILPDIVTLVPEKREELTTEGGLNMEMKNLKEKIDELKSAGIIVSVFIEPEPEMIKLADKFGCNAVEIHTGCYANLKNTKEINEEISKIEKAAKLIKSAGMKVVAGHGLNYHNVLPLVKIGLIEEFNIGHSIISRSIFTGLAEAVSSMKQLLG
ncbi:MAG: pyridoxine 5'-phosphate synthase [Candidatus Cloacimonetes bacterium]|nr:pyridoxine 5'-phosphate synthase [Candidatus Cloacimonadota bacterium]